VEVTVGVGLLRKRVLVKLTKSTKEHRKRTQLHTDKTGVAVNRNVGVVAWRERRKLARTNLVITFMYTRQTANYNTPDEAERPNKLIREEASGWVKETGVTWTKRNMTQRRQAQ
jgi:hypothetical protein